MRNANLHLAKDKKNDEFYTKYEDVEAWVKLYQSQGGTAHITPNTHYLVYTKNGKAVSPYRRILIKRK